MDRLARHRQHNPSEPLGHAHPLTWTCLATCLVLPAADISQAVK
jgi:hypothetical protein